MLPLPEIGLFALAALGLVLTPGPNMIYLISRSLCQGKRAGLISLAGVVTGFAVHIVAASLGITALFLAVPFAFATLKYLGALYLLWLAIQALVSRSPFEARHLPDDPPAKLFRMGFLTNVLNPKVAVFYLSFFPQFVKAAYGSVFFQSLTLGVTQMCVSFSVNLLIVCTAARVAAFLGLHPAWLRIQRYFMATILGGLAVRLALAERR